MASAGGDVTRVSEMIAHYVRRHPHAADTSSGVAEWWLHHAEDSVQPGVVEAALELLVANGTLKRTVNADGLVIFAAADAGPRDRQGKTPVTDN